MASSFFAIGDVHGCAEELRALVRKLPLDQDSTLLFLGDYVDRGPDSKGVIDTILDLSQIYRVITLQGNHEALFRDFLARPDHAETTSNFVLNGGSSTLASYSGDGVRFEVPPAHRKFLRELRYYHSTPTHFFAHAGVPPGFDFARADRVEGKPGSVDAKTAYQLVWIRSVFLDSREKWPKLVVHGHTPVDAPDIRPNRVNLDTGCVFGGRLTALNVATGELFSVARNEASAPRFLISPFQGDGPIRAQRFTGEVAVEIDWEGERYPFRTVNFNEFGLLIFPGEAAKNLQFPIGQKLRGFIHPGGDMEFDFVATVMRTDAVQGVVGFGLKFDSLRNLREHPAL